ncbi:MAG: hypothetical protein HN380_24380 [Victivallales bacterium]|nr:hypothetical protein [Victivallales bacterium]
MTPLINRKAVALAIVGSMFASVVAAPVTPPARNLVTGGPSGPWRRLFLDGMVVEQQTGLTRVFHAARRHGNQPVLPKTHASEGSGPYLYGTVMWDQNKLRMWYHSYQGGYTNHYAESTDGINWTRPKLGLVEFEGSKDNNIFLKDSAEIEAPELYRGGGKCHNPSVIKRPWETDPNKRYVLFCYGQEYRHARAAFSPDGLRWAFVKETARTALFASSDVLNFFYDPYKAQYVSTLKTGNRRGRAAGVATSRDGLTWTKPYNGAVFGADDLDPDATQVYGMPAFPYQGLYIGLPWIYNARWFKNSGYTAKTMYEAEMDSPCTMDVQLAWSWDLVHWTRPPQRGQFIPHGPKGTFDSDMIYTAPAPVQVGDKLYFYYGGWDGPHNSVSRKGKRPAEAAIGLAVLRLDGFCSMHADASEGSLISRRELFQTPTVTINAKTGPGGYVVAEVLDRHNQVIPGFSRDDCAPFSGDAVQHQLTWKTKKLPKGQATAEKKFRFFLKNADLYSYLPDPTVGPTNAVLSYDVGAANGLKPDDAKLPGKRKAVARGDASRCTVAEEAGLRYLDLHSVAARQSNASYGYDVTWPDREDWCLEAWFRVVDQGTEPNYGLSSFIRPDNGRGAALFMNATSVGIMSSRGDAHIVLRKVPFDTTDGFHWYRLVHSGGANGQLALEMDGKELVRLPYTQLFPRNGRGGNITFGPNAAGKEGRMHVAKFGFRIGSTKTIFKPVTFRAGE